MTADNDQQCPSEPRPGLGPERPILTGVRARHFLRNKKQEWEEYRSEVTAFELRKSLPVL